ncbi:MucR family transcriptional regulator [Sphingobium fluviale]|uniref:MucR family transcriptional regulator n=1 Tax=Sphingobium fluviale TaxID=2506423 RepID=A0A4Q1KLL2_9SPHN|nr:MucR family transcriptional regulator [Sphingobium fluviale]RXR30748.1 MucR family transcriptional regulator [Sphingobium fluviale]
MEAQSDQDLNLLTLTADIVSAHVGNNSVAISDLANLIASVHASLAGLGTTDEPETVAQEPAVAVKRSVKPDYIICLEDGKQLKMLKRHLMTHYQMTPEQYRAKWKLPADYPMVAPNYAEKRRALAKKIGLGRKPGKVKTAAVRAPAPAKKASAPRKELSVAAAKG